MHEHPARSKLNPKTTEQPEGMPTAQVGLCPGQASATDMPELTASATFAVATLVILVFPGPGALYVAPRSLAQGTYGRHT